MTPDAIRTLSEGEFRGWWKEVLFYRTRGLHPGELDELKKRARVLKIPLDSLPMGRGNAKKEAGREGFADPLPPLDITRTMEVQEHAR